MNFLKRVKIINKQCRITITTLTTTKTPIGIQTLIKTITNAAQLQYEKDPAPIFTDTITQKLLKSITQLQMNKIYRRTTAADNSVEYKFMTNEQLEDEFREAIKNAKKKLQMPPVVMIRPDTQTIISNDKALKNFADSKFVFTDITYGIKHSKRKVVIREIDGTLHEASIEIAKRMKQLYVPIPGRKIKTPKMFEDANFQRCLDERQYEFILDRLIVQYDPDESEYHRLTSLVYLHLMETKDFDQLRSTRHFGPMAFFYAWHKCIDDLLFDMIKRDYLRNATELIILHYKLHAIPENYNDVLKKLDECNTVEECAFKELMKQIQINANATTANIHQEIEMAIGKNQMDFQMDQFYLEFVEKFIKLYSLKKIQLELALQTWKEINAEKKQLFDGLTKAHGIQRN